jgi:hypothetical protein
MDIAFSIAAFLASAASLAVVLLRKSVFAEKAPLYAEITDENNALRDRIKALESSLSVIEEQHRALRAKLNTENLDEHAVRAVSYAEQLGGSDEEKLRHALGACKQFDKDANGLQDWTDAQHRIAIEAALARRKAARAG